MVATNYDDLIEYNIGFDDGLNGVDLDIIGKNNYYLLGYENGNKMFYKQKNGESNVDYIDLT